MTQPTSLAVFLIKVVLLMKRNMPVRSVCLNDVFEFYYDENDAACEFSKDDFTDVFINKTGRCQLVDCSIDSMTPSYYDLKRTQKYEIEKIELHLLSKPYGFVFEKPCGRYFNDDVEVTIKCEGTYQGREIGDWCDKDLQCVRLTVNSSCNSTSGVCQCKQGHVYLSEINTCSPVRELGEFCYDSRQCKRVNQYSMCSIDNQCECHQGYTKLNNSCLPERHLNETCADDIQCSAVTPNSTCNNITMVCECTEGHLEMLNLCVHGRILMEGINEQCKKLSSSIHIIEDQAMENICSMYSEPVSSTFEEKKGSNSGYIIGVGIAGLVLGIALCGLIYFIVTRQRSKSHQSKIETSKEEILHQQSVQVSMEMNRKKIQHEKRCENAVENEVYNHLHEDPFGVSVQPDYDHVPQLHDDDDYSHLATSNSTNIEGPGDYGMVS